MYILWLLNDSEKSMSPATYYDTFKTLWFLKEAATLLHMKDPCVHSALIQLRDQ